MKSGGWNQIENDDTLEGKRVLILGTGNNGQETAKKLKCFGSYTVGICRTSNNKYLSFDEIYTIDSVDTQLRSADVVIIALPGTAETAGMFDAERIKKMKAKQMNVNEYLNGHNVTEIKVGQSGADVYEIDGRYVLKHVARQKLNEELFVTYTREVLFYRNQMKQQRIYLPKVLEAEHSENEILILMKKYCSPKRDTINAELLQKITKSLAALHTDVPPSFMCKDQEKAEQLSDQTITECLCGWKSVLDEHPNSFNENPLEEIASKINRLIAWHDSEDRMLIHGDFHWDNLLEDRKGNILFCDWQGVNLGGASGDLSFFLSRLGADGIRIDATAFLDYYINAIEQLSGKQIQRQDIIRHMNAANVITSFLFWHEYLHGSSKERVEDIYGKMTKDFFNN